MKPINLFLLIAALLYISPAHSQIITAFAGNQTIGYTGDGGPATAATFRSPVDVKLDASGNLFISDQNNVIRKVDASGIISTVVGTGTAGYSGDGGPATSAQINQVSNVTFDNSGNMYIGDVLNQVVRKVTPAGIISTFAGHNPPGSLGDGGPATAASMAGSGPVGIVTDALGNVYISNGMRVRKVDPSGIITTIAGNGTPGFSGDGGPATAAQISATRGMVYVSPNLYVCDVQNYDIRKINIATGIITTFAGSGIAGHSGDGGPATAASMIPTDIATDGTNFFVADQSVVRKINAAGIISTIAGDTTTVGGGLAGDGGPAPAAHFLAGGIDIDPVGRVYITDATYDEVRRIDTTTDHFPSFTTALPAGLVVCENSGPNSIDTLLRIIDPDLGQTETWSFISSVAGAVGGFNTSVIATGGIQTPSGLTYAPALNYTGNDYFVIQISDGIGVSRIGINVTVNPAPDPITGGTGICTGSSVQLSDAPGGGTWSSSNTASVTMSSAGMVYGSAAGGSDITYSLAGGCISVASVTVSLSPAAITGPSGVCIGAAITLSDGFAGGTWSSGSMGVATISNTGTIYPVTTGATVITYATNCGSITQTVTVHPLPTPVITASGSVLSTSASYTSYQWYLSGTAIPGATNFSYTALSNGTYLVAVTDGNGCSASSPASTISHLGVTSLNSSESIITYPNPAHDQLIITCTGKINDVAIYDLVGQMVYHLICNDEVVHADISGLPPGIYIARINGVVIRKVIKE